MKKAPKGCLVVVLVVVALCALSVGAMFALQICPPAGPWPQPPWCSGSTIQVGELQATVAAQVAQSGADQLVEQALEKLTPEPTSIPVGTPLNLSLEVILPLTDQPVEMDLNGQVYPLQAQSLYDFTAVDIPVKTGDTLTYFFKAGDLQTQPVQRTVQTADPLREGLPWDSTPLVSKPGFMMGHTIMDAGGNIPTITRTGELDDTLEAMQQDGGEWFVYDYYWSYKDYTKPEIVDESTFDTSAATEEDLAHMAEMAHARGMKFLLLTELEWSVLPEELDQVGNTVDSWMEFQNEKWDKGQAFDREMGERLDQNPDDPEVQAYWDSWFEQFGAFMLHTARVAEANHVEAITLGKQLGGAMSVHNEARWRKLIQDVRAVYHGQITQALWNGEFGPYLDVPWLDDLDFITIFYYNRLSDEEQPSLETLQAAFEQYNRQQFDPLYQRTGKPLVMLLPFQSRDHAAQQQWFEPMASSAGVGQDLLAQADLYEAFFQSTLDEPWLGGVLSWGYWITPDFPAEYSFEKSSSVRGKPASLVMRKWFAQVEAP